MKSPKKGTKKRAQTKKGVGMEILFLVTFGWRRKGARGKTSTEEGVEKAFYFEQGGLFLEGGQQAVGKLSQLLPEETSKGQRRRTMEEPPLRVEGPAGDW